MKKFLLFILMAFSFIIIATPPELKAEKPVLNTEYSIQNVEIENHVIISDFEYSSTVLSCFLSEYNVYDNFIFIKPVGSPENIKSDNIFSCFTYSFNVSLLPCKRLSLISFTGIEKPASLCFKSIIRGRKQYSLPFICIC